MADTNAHCIEVCAEVRYWEDARVNGADDNDGTLIPFRIGSLWKPLIRLADGYIIGWPEGTTASIHYKVADQGEYWLTDESQERIAKWKGDYVPDEFLCVGDNGYGDYIIFKVGADGKIAGWTLPDIVDKEWVLLPVDNDDLAQVMKAHPTRVTAAGVALLQQEIERLKATPPADAALADALEAASNRCHGQDVAALRKAAAALRARTVKPDLTVDARAHTIAPSLIVDYGRVQHENEKLREELAALRARPQDVVAIICNAYEDGVSHGNASRGGLKSNPHTGGSNANHAWALGFHSTHPPAIRARPQAVAAFVPYTDAELREWFPVMCNHCGWRGLSRDCTGGGPIADTGDFNEITCPQCWSDGDGKAVDPREVVVVDGRRPIADVADIRTAVGFIFGRFCRPEDAREVPDDVVAAVRRLESAVGPDTIVQRAKRHALYRAENQSVTREGFVLVPAKPTSDQLLAGIKTMFRSHGTQNGVVGEVYRAMLAASQSATGGAT